MCVSLGYSRDVCFQFSTLCLRANGSYGKINWSEKKKLFRKKCQVKLPFCFFLNTSIGIQIKKSILG